MYRLEPQRNVVLRLLNQLRERGNREVEEGFAAILSDYLSSTKNCGVPDMSFYEELVDRCATHLEVPTPAQIASFKSVIAKVSDA